GLDLVLPRGPETDDESIASLLRRRFGEEAVERLGEPLMAGIHAGDPERLSMRATFPRFVELERKRRSLIRGMWAARPKGSSSGGSAFSSLVGGLAELVAAMTGRLPPGRVRLGVPVLAVGGSGAGLVATLADGTAIEAPAVILAAPAPSAARLLEG